MAASIISLSGPDKKRDSRVESADACTADPFDAYVGCLMTTGYALSGSLLAPAAKPACHYIARFVDDPALLAKIEAHPARQKLLKFLLGYVLFEYAQTHLWREIEELLSPNR